MKVKPTIATVMFWVTGVACFGVFWVGGLGSLAFANWSGMTRLQVCATVLTSATMLEAFPVFLMFKRWSRFAVFLQWSVVIFSIVMVDLYAAAAEPNSSLFAKLGAGFEPQNCLFVFPLIPAILLSILYWLRRPPQMNRSGY